MRKSQMKLLKVDMKCARKCSRSVQYFLESKRVKKIIVGGIFRICKHFRSEQALVYIYSLSSSVCLSLHTNLRMPSTPEKAVKTGKKFALREESVIS